MDNLIILTDRLDWLCGWALAVQQMVSDCIWGFIRMDFALRVGYFIFQYDKSANDVKNNLTIFRLTAVITKFIYWCWSFENINIKGWVLAIYDARNACIIIFIMMTQSTEIALNMLNKLQDV